MHGTQRRSGLVVPGRVGNPGREPNPGRPDPVSVNVVVTSGDPGVYVLPAPRGRRLLAAQLCVGLVIDQSGSMTGSDPLDLRIAEAGSLVRWVARYQHPADRIGIAQFADRARVSITPTPVGAGTPRIIAALRPDHRVGGGTDLVGAFQVGRQLMAAAPKGSWRVLVVFTDGAGQDDPDQIRDAIARSGADAVYLIALDADGTYTAIQDFWEDPATGLAGVAHLDGTAQPAQIAHALGETITTETGQHLPPPPSSTR